MMKKLIAALFFVYASCCFSATFSQNNTLNFNTITPYSLSDTTLQVSSSWSLGQGAVGFNCNITEGNSSAGQTWSTAISVQLPSTIEVNIEYTNPYVVDRYVIKKEKVTATITAGNAANNIYNNGGTRTCTTGPSGSMTCSTTGASTLSQKWGFRNTSNGNLTFVMPKTPGYNVKSLSLATPINNFCTWTTTLNGVLQNTYTSSVTTAISADFSPFYIGPGSCWAPAFLITLPDLSSSVLSAASIGGTAGTPQSSSNPIVCETGGVTALPASMSVSITGGVPDPTINASNTNGAFKNVGTALGVTGKLEWNATTPALNTLAPVVYGTSYSLTPASNSPLQLRASYVKTSGSAAGGTVDSGVMQLNLVYN